MRTPALVLLAVLALVGVALSCDDTEEVLPQVPETGTPPPSGSPIPTERPSQATTPTPATATAPGTTPSAGADWKEYTDALLGFTLRYPPALRSDKLVFELAPRNGHSGVQQTTIRFVDNDGNSAFGVSAVPNPDNLGLDEWIRLYPGWPCEPKSSPTCGPEQVTIAGEPGVRFSIGVVGDPAATVYLAHKGRIYSLSAVAPSGESDAPITPSDFEKVLATFDFTEG